ncbi:MAG: Ribosomal large subunit pseudouridine synthase D [Myxococcota bacterium]|nr:Ribosomal large subunit pseudouridine synthase D [Myxococcota bacterium]
MNPEGELRQMTVGPGLEGRRLDAVLAELLGDVTRSRVRGLMEGGRVSVNGAARKPAYKVRQGDVVELVIPPPPPMEPVPQPIPIDILYQDDALAVINKPPGLVVHPAVGNPDNTLVNALVYHFNELAEDGAGGEARPGLVHRLDKDTSGVMVIAKNEKSHAKLSNAFKDRRVSKEYLAVVYGTPYPAKGVWDTFFGRSPSDRKKFSSLVREGKRAITRYETILEAGGLSAQRIDLETGRTHQIRVHFADHNHPVVADTQYGSPRRVNSVTHPELRELVRGVTRQLLHARKLSFPHPVNGVEMTFEAPLREDMAAVLDLMEHIRREEKK